MQLELATILDQGYYTIDYSNGSYQNNTSLLSVLPRSSEEDDLIFPNEITNSYGVVTDTVSFLPFVGIWDVEKYNGVNRVIGADGEY